MRIEILGTPAVSGRAGTVTGASLGGRRAQVALVALALDRSSVTSDCLAEMIWAGDRPGTWQPALRGVIRGLRMTLQEAAGLLDDRDRVTEAIECVRRAIDAARPFGTISRSRR